MCLSRRLPRVSCVKWGPLWLGIFFTVVFLFCYTSLSPRLICFYIKIGTQRGLSVWLHGKLTADVLETFQNALQIILGESAKWLGSRKSPVRIRRPSSASVRNERSCCLLSCMIFAIISCVYILSDFSNSLSILLETQMVSAYSASLYSRDLNYYYYFIRIRSENCSLGWPGIHCVAPDGLELLAPPWDLGSIGMLHPARQCLFKGMPPPHEHFSCFLISLFWKCVGIVFFVFKHFIYFYYYAAVCMICVRVHSHGGHVGVRGYSGVDAPRPSLC